MEFAIVTFIGENTVDIISTCWYCKGKKYCYWPPFKSLKLIEAAVEGQKPADTTWKLFNIRVFKE